MTEIARASVTLEHLGAAVHDSGGLPREEAAQFRDPAEIEGLGSIPAETEQDGPAKYRNIAETLRQMARQTRFDPRRNSQLQALADGFARLAARIERETTHQTERQRGK